MTSDEENICDNTPSGIHETANNVVRSLLPDKSKKNYECTYKIYKDWKTTKGVNISSEAVLLAYFDELAKQYKPTTIWSIYPKLKSTINIEEKVDISKCNALSAFLEKQSRGFRCKKATVFTPEQIQLFLENAPDNRYLATKIVLIFGIFGALRTDELTNIEIQHIREQGELLQVEIPKTKTMQPRSFVIAEDCVKYFKQYQSLRPKNVPSTRFSVNYQNGKCTTQVIGKNKFSVMPKQIAEFLNLPDVASYTGHSFRCTSATVLVDEGANIETLKRHGGWKSSTVAEGYIAESFGNKKKIGDMINSSINPPSTSSRNTEVSSPKRPKKNNESKPATEVSSTAEQKIFSFQNCTVTINYTGNPKTSL